MAGTAAAHVSDQAPPPQSLRHPCGVPLLAFPKLAAPRSMVWAAGWKKGQKERAPLPFKEMT